MAPRKTVEPVELSPEDVWNDLISENVVPPLVVKGIVLEQPTIDQLAEYDAANDRGDNAAAEKALFAEHRDDLKALFAGEKKYVWDNFVKMYLEHMLGLGDPNSLKG